MAHIQELEKNKKYKLIVEVGTDTRKRRTRTVKASGIREARRLLREFQNEIDEMAHLDTSDPSFVAFSNLWMENYALEELQPNTSETYKQQLEYIKEYFKDYKLRDIKPFNITQFFNAEKRSGRASLPLKHKILTSIFKHSVLWQIIDEKNNPMTNVPVPDYTNRQEIDHYRFDEVPILMDLINKDLNERQQLIVKLALFGGLRRGEVAGIASDVLDFENNKITIKRSLQGSKREGLKLKETKSEDTRTITIPENLMKDLHEYYIKKLSLRMEMGNLWKGFKDINGKEVFMLFANEYGIPIRPDSITRFWRRFNERNKDKIRRIRFHDLRHSSATIILSESDENITMRVVQERLGHKDVKTTLRFYSHVTTEDDEHESSIFDQFL